MTTYADQPDPKMFRRVWRSGSCTANMEIGATQLMGSDAPPERFQPMRSVYLSLAVDSSDEAERIFKLLNEGGDVFMPMAETFFAFRFGMLRDRFGTSWMILHQKPMPAS